MLRRPRVTKFGDVIEITTSSIKTILKDSKEVKINRGYVLKRNLCLCFLI